MTGQKWHIWVGMFSDEAPEEYFSGEWREREEGEPMNQFAGEQGEQYLDYDFLEISFVDAGEAQSPREFVAGHSYSDSYLEQVAELAEGLGLHKINVFVLAREGEFTTPKSVDGEGYTLAYLGLFDCGD